MKDLEDTKSQFKQSETRSLQERQKHSETLKSVQTKALEDQQAAKQELDKKVSEIQAKQQTQAKKQEKGTRLVIALQNRVRDMFERKLNEAQEETAKLLKEVDKVEQKASKFEQEYMQTKDTHAKFK